MLPPLCSVIFHKLLKILKLWFLISQLGRGSSSAFRAADARPLEAAEREERSTAILMLRLTAARTGSFVKCLLALTKGPDVPEAQSGSKSPAVLEILLNVFSLASGGLASLHLRQPGVWIAERQCRGINS